MPLRYVRSKLSADGALSVAVATASISRDLAELAQFPPAKAAAGILLLIFQTIQDVQSNRNECYRLARRCLSFMIDIRDQMEGRWEDAPPSLLSNITRLERTLQSIHVCMTAEAEQKWHSRLLRKTTIEESIAAYHEELNDAARAFQMATLIHIHYTVGDGLFTGSRNSRAFHNSGTVDSDAGVLDIKTGSPSNRVSPESNQASTDMVASPTSVSSSLRVEFDEDVLLSEPGSLETSLAEAAPAASDNGLDDRGFRRYHRSEVRLKGRTKTKSGWWFGTCKAQVDGRDVLVKRYDVRANKWIRDVKTLQKLYHPNLPQMIGYSDDETPTPFILLANYQTRLPQALVLDTIQRSDLQTCAQLIFRFYRDTLDAALYMQRQLNLSDQQLQDYVENANYRIDGEDTLIMGLPPAEIDRWVSFRNYGLSHSIRQIYLKILPNAGYAQQPVDLDDIGDLTIQRRVAHLAVLARAILHESEDPEALRNRLNSVLNSEEDDETNMAGMPLTLRQIRLIAISADQHNHIWRPNTVPAHKYRLGDLGWIPPGTRFEEMTILCNVLDEKLTSLQTVERAIGWQGSWEGGFRKKQDLEPFPLPNDVYGWPVVVPAGTDQDLQVLHEKAFVSSSGAWRFLLDHGKSLANAKGVKPEDLVLVTRAGTDQIFTVRDRRILPVHHFNRPAHVHGAPFGHQMYPGFAQAGHFAAHHHLTHIHNRPEPPMILYLFSSLRQDHVPVWDDSPIFKPGNELYLRNCNAGASWIHGYVNYVQLHEDDFKS